MIEIACPHCNTQLRIDDKYAGMTGKCRACGARVSLPPLRTTESEEEGYWPIPPNDALRLRQQQAAHPGPSNVEQPATPRRVSAETGNSLGVDRESCPRTEFVTLSCPACGGTLQITDDIDRFACAYCGTEHIVRRGGGLVSLAPVIQGLTKVQAGVDRTATELAIQRLEREIDRLEDDMRRLSEGLTKKGKDWEWYILGLVIAGFVCFGLGIAAFTRSQHLAGAAIFLIGVFLVVAAFIVTAFLEEEKEEKLAIVQKQITEKRVQLEKHRKEVDI